MKREQYFDERPEVNPIQLPEVPEDGSESFYRRSSDISYTLRTPEENIEVVGIYQRRIASHHTEQDSEESDVY